MKKELRDRDDHLSSGCLSSLAVLTLWVVTTHVSIPWQEWPVRVPTSSFESSYLLAEASMVFMVWTIKLLFQLCVHSAKHSATPFSR